MKDVIVALPMLPSAADAANSRSRPAALWSQGAELFLRAYALTSRPFVSLIVRL